MNIHELVERTKRQLEHRQCFFCEERRYRMLDIHHIDGNRKNNNIENLVLLCPNHHREVHLGWKKLPVDK